MEILINLCHGGFGLSCHCKELYTERTGKVPRIYSDELRYDPVLIEIFKEKGAEWCNGFCANLELTTVPIRLKNYYQIKDYDGQEWIELEPYHAISDCTEEYLKNPTPEKLEWLRQEVAEIKAYVNTRTLE